MSRQIQIRRGTTSEHTSFTGAIGEITMDTTTNTLRVHDGETAGGIPLARTEDLTNLQTDISNQGLRNYIATCSTASATAQKDITINNFVLTPGVRFKIKFTNKNTATTPTIKINSLNALSITDESGTAVSSTNPAYFPAGAWVDFYYDGTNAVYEKKIIKSYYDNSTYIRWYNLRSDGWIEQGGKVSAVDTVTLPVSMASIEFVVSGKVTAIATSSTGRIIAVKDNSTASVLNVLRNDSGFQWNFEVRGYIA
ncbi:MAG TPA: hypothetical protein PKJ33_04195 [Alphaproteobacteria bacterium]|nr:hypothetical protein [Alphaproteobacteria bacterium]